ncbi:MAG: (E)-4-hydroxy-3-methylbut-2-enyl-diphosphate synthase [Muribaculaceae bacterium]|nr:(E)-4-hydroxy-3-methylbut-2-enyl-diphosphate synthase [Muribaculaceae bacterium]
MSIFNYNRRKTISVNVGGTPLGSEHPIRLQSMASTSTMDTEGSVAQCGRIANAGASYIRLTAQGVREAENLGNIKAMLRENGVNTPLVADIHFNPRAAFAAAEVVEKVRINPGNFVDPGRTFQQLSYTDEEYAEEIKKIEATFVPFIELCRKNNTAIRIGVNHGSLSDRIMSRYGDTPAGMVESAMEFLRVCVAHDFLNVVISIKASNTVIMVETMRRLVVAMEQEGMQFPLHLGVTEAGDGEDGRVKSAVGIGTLLAEGIGDTIRVSLSEEPECEIPVAEALVNYITCRQNAPKIKSSHYDGYCYEAPSRRQSNAVANIGGNALPIVIANGYTSKYADGCTPDYFYIAEDDAPSNIVPERVILPAECGKDGYCKLFTWEQREVICSTEAPIKFLEVDASTEVTEVATYLNDDVVIVLHSSHINAQGEMQAFAHSFTQAGYTSPIVMRVDYNSASVDDVTLMAAADLGAILLNGNCDGVWLNAPCVDTATAARLSFGILQAARLRISRTEYISCPGCGRTLFDLQSTVKAVKEATAHLKGLKIGVMGCIVNGPGEMADADYGYVGAGVGKVSLYKNKTCIEKNIPTDQAIPRLIELIKSEGDWVDPA